MCTPTNVVISASELQKKSCLNLASVSSWLNWLQVQQYVWRLVFCQNVEKIHSFPSALFCLTTDTVLLDLSCIWCSFRDGTPPTPSIPHTLFFCLANFAARWIWMPLLMQLVFRFCLVFLSTLWQCDFRYISLFFVPPHCHLLSLPASLTFSFLDCRSCCSFPSLSSPNSHTQTKRTDAVTCFTHPVVTHTTHAHMHTCTAHFLALSWCKV